MKVLRSWSAAGAAAVTALPLVLLPTFTTNPARAAAPPGPYAVTDLGTLGTVQSAQAHGINDAGQVVGAAAGHPFLWQNGLMTDLNAVAGTRGSASDINNAGQIVGGFQVSTTATGRPVLWENGAMTDLSPGAPGGSASGINDLGEVVGVFSDWTGFLWRNGAITSLGRLGGGASSGSDINNAGQVVGWSHSTHVTELGPMAHAFLWQDGVMTDLGVLPGGADESWAAAINNLGQIVGTSSHTDFETYATTSQSFIYETGAMRALPVPSSESYAVDINDSGVVVGTMRAGGGMSPWHAYIYADGVVTNLNSLIPPGSGLHLLFANGINNAGQIVGAAYDSRASYHAFLLTPVAPGASVVNIGDASVTEGHTGTRSADLTVTLSPASSQPVTVSYSTANGSAGDGDYQPASGTVTFAAGETARTVSVLVNGDRAGELDESFMVNVGLAAGSAVIADSQGVGTIVDDEPRVSINSVTKNEGHSATTPFVFTVSLSPAPSAAVSLNFATANGSAKSTEDYTAASGTLSFAAGQTSRTITVAVKGDRTSEYQEVFYVNLSGASGVLIPQSWGVNIQGTGVIRNDDR
jgi:probable HAF family extracellular repeat protein